MAPYEEEKTCVRSSPERNRGRRVVLSWSWWVVFCLHVPASTGKHTLIYLFTVQSAESSHNTYQFSVETLLDDTQTDSYSSRDGIRTPKQSWVKEIKKSEWRTGTEKLNHDGGWVNKVLQLQLEAFRHKASERHVLQWRNGCEGEKLPNGSVSTLNCIHEYGYDGEDLMSYNWTSRQWSVSVKEAQEKVEKLKSGEGSDAALICQDCWRWMKVYLQYTPQHTPSEYLETSVPDVYVFVNKSQTESSRLTLTCLATGFYPKDLKMRLRIFTTSLPDHLLTSSGVRHNGDGTYQLRKSVDVQEEDAAGYDCSVSHVSFSGALNTPWDGRCSNCRNNLSPGVIGGVTVGVIEGVILLVLLGAVTFILLSKRGKTDWRRDGGSDPIRNEPEGFTPVPTDVGFRNSVIYRVIKGVIKEINNVKGNGVRNGNENEVSNGDSNPTVNGPEGVQLLPPGEGKVCVLHLRKGDGDVKGAGGDTDEGSES
ncbi:H-2 class I histocompatibility antigen, alpha chain-like [Hoplias malabaricus]|uniref:H-2 class I histocompatibility antigen, alpha chain-like n=1 Tax=Hoplias malabaricus TaxID=27720 RepID=UPI0034630C4D